MSTETKTIEVDPQEQEDLEAVFRHALHGQPLNPDTAQRVEERADRITEEIRRAHGIIDDATFEELLRNQGCRVADAGQRVRLPTAPGYSAPHSNPFRGRSQE